MQLFHDGILVGLLAREPGVERFGATEDIREQEIEERPELVQIVLQRSAGDQESVA